MRWERQVASKSRWRRVMNTFNVYCKYIWIYPANNVDGTHNRLLPKGTPPLRNTSNKLWQNVDKRSIHFQVVLIRFFVCQMHFGTYPCTFFKYACKFLLVDLRLSVELKKHPLDKAYSIVKGNIFFFYHISWECWISVDGKCSQSKQEIPQCGLYWLRESWVLLFAELRRQQLNTKCSRRIAHGFLESSPTEQSKSKKGTNWVFSSLGL